MKDRKDNVSTAGIKTLSKRKARGRLMCFSAVNRPGAGDGERESGRRMAAREGFCQ